MRAVIIAGALLALAGSPALGQARLQPADARVRLVDYDPNRVTPIRAAPGFQLMLEFSVDERIENVSIGDSVGWQVTPNRRANLLFLKPIDGQATNMTVVTDRRRYLFDLSLANGGARRDTPYAIRFIYPAPLQAGVIKPSTAPVATNTNYAISGAPESQPTRVFDDGELTYFEWAAQSATPAIFAVSRDGSESLVNYAVRGPYTVVQQLAPRFTLRNGKQVASVVNGGYPIETAGRKPQ